MMELELKTVAEAEESNFTCRSCEKVELGFGRIGREWADTVQESKWEIRVEREKRVQLEAQVGDMNKRAEADVVEMTREWERMLTREQEAAIAAAAQMNLLTKVTEMCDSVMQRLAHTPGQQETPPREPRPHLTVPVYMGYDDVKSVADFLGELQTYHLAFGASEAFIVDRIVPLALLPAPGYATQILRELEAKTQHPDESLVRCVRVMQELFKRADPKSPESDRVARVRRQCHPRYHVYLINRAFEMLEVPARGARLIEEALHTERNYVPPPPAKQLSSDCCYECEQPGHHRKQCPRLLDTTEKEVARDGGKGPEPKRPGKLLRLVTLKPDSHSPTAVAVPGSGQAAAQIPSELTPFTKREDCIRNPTTAAHFTTVPDVLPAGVRESLRKCPASSQQKQELQAVPQSFSPMFTETPGKTDILLHRIETGDAPPRRGNPRPISVHKRALLDAALEEMIDTSSLRGG
ncbi:hypothetical protein ISCGN_013558 [Ixodes scapularis]